MAALPAVRRRLLKENRVFGVLGTVSVTSALHEIENTLHAITLEFQVQNLLGAVAAHIFLPRRISFVK